MPRLLELFSGTGSVGKAFKGWEIVSLDLDKKSKATITSDILQWDYTVFPRGHFDCIWASPPCTQYSICRTTAKTPRNLDLADSRVRRTLEIIAYFNPEVWWVENPFTGLLKGREVVQGLPYLVVDYCMYGSPYKKRTLFLTNVSWPLKLCDKSHCVDGRHSMSAQRRPTRINGVLRENDTCTLDMLHALPERLCAEICTATCLALGLQRLGAPEEPFSYQTGRRTCPLASSR